MVTVAAQDQEEGMDRIIIVEIDVIIEEMIMDVMEIEEIEIEIEIHTIETNKNVLGDDENQCSSWERRMRP